MKAVIIAGILLILAYSIEYYNQYNKSQSYSNNSPVKVTVNIKVTRVADNTYSVDFLETTISSDKILKTRKCNEKAFKTDVVFVLHKDDTTSVVFPNGTICEAFREKK